MEAKAVIKNVAKMEGGAGPSITIITTLDRGSSCESSDHQFHICE